MSNNYIKLFRQITEWEWYTDYATKDVFLHLLVTANRFPKSWKGTLIDTGQRVTSVGKIAQETGLSVKNVRTALKHLQKTNEISLKATNKYTLITIENYSMFQVYDGEDGKQVASKGQASGKQVATNKKGRKEERKNVIKDTTYPCQNLVDSYNNICESLPKVEKLTDKRKTHIKARLKGHSEDEIKMAFIKAEESDFLSGRKSDWHADFDWITKSEDNLVKILEGHYDNRDHIVTAAENELSSLYEGADEEKLKRGREVLQ